MRRYISIVLCVLVLLPAGARGGPDDSLIFLDHRQLSDSQILKAFEAGISLVQEFSDLRDFAHRHKLNIHLFGGTASSYMHYMRLALEREMGNRWVNPFRMTFKLNDIFDPLQDIDLAVSSLDNGVVSSDALGRVQAFASRLFRRKVDVLGLHTAWVDAFGKSRPALKSVDFLNQYLDSHSTVLINLTPNERAPLIHDLQHPGDHGDYFLKLWRRNEIELYPSSHHLSSPRYLNGLNPIPLSSIRFLIKMFRYNLRPAGQSLVWVKNNLSAKSMLGHQQDYLRKWLAIQLPKLLLYISDLPYAKQVLADIGFTPFLSDPHVRALLSTEVMNLFSRVPLNLGRRSIDIRNENHSSGLVITHETDDLSARSIRWSPYGRVNAFVSRPNIEGENARFGLGFYTSLGPNGQGTRKGSHIRMSLHASSEEKTHYERLQDRLLGNIYLLKDGVRIEFDTLEAVPLETAFLESTEEFVKRIIALDQISPRDWQKISTHAKQNKLFHLSDELQLKFIIRLVEFMTPMNISVVSDMFYKIPDRLFNKVEELVINNDKSIESIRSRLVSVLIQHRKKIYRWIVSLKDHDLLSQLIRDKAFKHFYNISTPDERWHFYNAVTHLLPFVDSSLRTELESLRPLMALDYQQNQSLNNAFVEPMPRGEITKLIEILHSKFSSDLEAFLRFIVNQIRLNPELPESSVLEIADWLEKQTLSSTSSASILNLISIYSAVHETCPIVIQLAFGKFILKNTEIFWSELNRLNDDQMASKFVSLIKLRILPPLLDARVKKEALSRFPVSIRSLDKFFPRSDYASNDKETVVQSILTYMETNLKSKNDSPYDYGGDFFEPAASLHRLLLDLENEISVAALKSFRVRFEGLLHTFLSGDRSLQVHRVLDLLSLFQLKDKFREAFSISLRRLPREDLEKTIQLLRSKIKSKMSPANTYLDQEIVAEILLYSPNLLFNQSREYQIILEMKPGDIERALRFDNKEWSHEMIFEVLEFLATHHKLSDGVMNAALQRFALGYLSEKNMQRLNRLSDINPYWKKKIIDQGLDSSGPLLGLRLTCHRLLGFLKLAEL